MGYEQCSDIDHRTRKPITCSSPYQGWTTNYIAFRCLHIGCPCWTITVRQQFNSGEVGVFDSCRCPECCRTLAPHFVHGRASRHWFRLSWLFSNVVGAPFVTRPRSWWRQGRAMLPSKRADIGRVQDSSRSSQRRPLSKWQQQQQQSSNRSSSSSSSSS